MITLLPVDMAVHGALINRWLASTHVSRWWGDPDGRMDQFGATGSAEHAIIARDDKPVGYLRWEMVDPQALASVGLNDIPPGSIDIDIFIGEPAETGRGTGPQALELLFSHLRETTDAPLAGLCSSVDNHRAHAAFEKAGCTRLTEFDDPTYGPCFVFVRHLR